VGSSAIAAGSILSAQIANGSLSGAEFQDGSIGAVDLAAGAVQAGHLAAGAVTASDLAVGAVNSSHVQDTAVYSGNIRNPSISPAKLADGSATNEKFAIALESYSSGAVSSTELITTAPAWEFCGLTSVWNTAGDNGTNRWCNIDETATGFSLGARAGDGTLDYTFCQMECF
jgi:hypothetical protein